MDQPKFQKLMLELLKEREDNENEAMCKIELLPYVHPQNKTQLAKVVENY
jgi:hypothetical protein